MDEFAICDVCKELFDGGLRCPRVLTCGHSFCSACIQKLLASSANCPTCELPIKEESLETISINYHLKKMVEKYLFRNANYTSGNSVSKEGECKMQPQLGPSQSKGFSKVHEVPKYFRCMTCSKWIRGDCAVIGHKLCKNLLVKEDNADVKVVKNIKIRKHLKRLSEGETTSLSLLEYYEEILDVKNELLKCYQQKVFVLKEDICEVNLNIEKISNLQKVLISLKEKLERQMKATNAATSASDLDKIEEKLTEHFRSLQDVVENLNVHKSSTVQIPENEIVNFFNNKDKLKACVTAGERILITTEEKKGITRYGEFYVEDDIYRIKSMPQEAHPPLSLCISLDNCLTALTGKNEWPNKIFLQFSSDDTFLGDVIIEFSGYAVQAIKTFKQMCLFGSEGKSFKGMGICQWSNYGDEKVISLRGMFPGLLGTDYTELKKEQKKKKWNIEEIGLIFSSYNNNFDMRICVERSKEEHEWIPIGLVKEGFEVVKDVHQRINNGEIFKVENCGWILG